jgi:methyl-accepting chemotaxis protein
MAERPYKRRINLVKRGLQLSVVFYILLTAVAVTAVQTWLIVWIYSQKTSEVGVIDQRAFVDIVLVALLATVLFTLVLSFVVGILYSHRFAGPIWKFEQALKQVAKGDISHDLRLRKGDLLMDFCAAFNSAFAGLRGIVNAERKALAEVEAALERLKEHLPAGAPGAEDVDLVVARISGLRDRFLTDRVAVPHAAPPAPPTNGNDAPRPVSTANQPA